jgi:hypothetical protein
MERSGLAGVDQAPDFQLDTASASDDLPDEHAAAFCWLHF